MNKKTKNKDLVLLDNVQFIYELLLVKLELSALGANFVVTDELNSFTLLNKSDELCELIKSRGAYYKAVDGQLTDYFKIIKKNQTRSINQYLTHWIYPYKGKFHPQMVRALLNIAGLKEGDTVLDPFSGSGTAALEAQLLGVNFIGIDISPLCVLQGKVKTKSIFVINKILKLKNNLIPKLCNKLSDRTEFYTTMDGIANEDVRNFFTLARLLAISDNSRRRRDIEQSFIRNIGLMIDSVKDYKNIVDDLNLELGSVDLTVGDARKIKLSDNSVDGVITSPPYSIALDYVKNDEHSFKDMGYNISDMYNYFIGVRGSLKDRVGLYNEDMKQVYSEIHRVLKPNKYAIIVIGDASYQKQKIKTTDFTIDTMEKLGFKLEKNINKIIFGIYNVMKQENILLFRKLV